MAIDPVKLRSSLHACAARTVELAQELGATQSEVGVNVDEGLTVTVRMGQLESVEHQGNRGLGVTVYKDGSKGSASTTDFSDAGVAEVVRKALSIASFTAADQYAGLADAALMATDPPDMDLFHHWSLDVKAAEALALSAESAARAADPRIANSEGASVSTEDAYRVYANSHGFLGGYPLSAHSISCSVLAKGDAGLERDYWATSARSAGGLEEAAHVGRVAAERALRRLGSRQIATRTAAVLYPPELARGLIGHLLGAIRGTNQYRRASFLLDAVGEQIFPSMVEIDEEPHIPQAFGSAAFDSDGVTTRARRLIDSGRLTGYVLSAYSARRLGLATTGNAGGIHNLLVRPTAPDGYNEFIAKADRLFVVGELLGQGVNTVTGDYSRGAAGFWVERGEIAYPVSEVTIAGNLRDMYRKFVAIGSDVDQRGVIRCGSILIADMTVAGQ